MAFANGNWTSDAIGDVTSEYTRDSSETVLTLGAAAGYEFKQDIRAEIEYMYRTNYQHDKKPTTSGTYDVEQDLTTHTVMLNVFYDFRNDSKFTPFIMAGAGLAIHESDNSVNELLGLFVEYEGREVTKTDFAWNVGAGVGYAINEHLTADVLLRYIDMGKARWENVAPIDEAHSVANMTATEVTFGLRYKF